MGGYVAYPEYKDSGVEWLGNIPKSWQTKRLKYISTYNDESLDENTDPDFELEYVDISSVSLVEGIKNSEVMIFDKSPSRARRKVRDGDTIISTVRTYLKSIAAIRNPPDNMIVSTGFAVIRPHEGQHPDYVGYLLQADGFVGEVVANSTGVGYPAINSSVLVRLPVVQPPFAEQQTIARFLDYKTAQIDALIAKKELLLKKLSQKRTAIISHAVTKGLDPSAPMKDSGNPWIGKIPAHWEVQRVKFAAKLESGHTPSKQVAEYWEDCDVPWVSLNDTKQLAISDYITETEIQINSLGLANSSARMLPAYSVVFTRDATIGLAAITMRPMAVSQHLIAWIPGPNITSLYLLRVFNAMRPFLDSFTFGSTIKTIGMPDVKKLATPMPPIQEQRAITTYLDQTTEKLDGLVKQIENARTRLVEYRTSLITHAVTGKIDVRSVPIPKQPEAKTV